MSDLPHSIREVRRETIEVIEAHQQLARETAAANRDMLARIDAVLGHVQAVMDYTAHMEARVAVLHAHLSARNAEIAADNLLLEELERVLAAVPPCPVHGRCVPHAVEWIERMKRRQDG